MAVSGDLAKPESLEIEAQLTGKSIEYGELALEQTGQLQLFITDPAGTSVELNFQVADPA